jgi:hypothetical protein
MLASRTGEGAALLLSLLALTLFLLRFTYLKGMRLQVKEASGDGDNCHQDFKAVNDIAVASASTLSLSLMLSLALTLMLMLSLSLLLMLTLMLMLISSRRLHFV